MSSWRSRPNGLPGEGESFGTIFATLPSYTPRLERQDGQSIGSGDARKIGFMGIASKDWLRSGAVSPGLLHRVMRLYYRRFFGRNVPGAELLGRVVARWEQQTRRGDIPLDPDTWENLYSNGNWGFLADLRELSHYSVLVGYLAHLKPGGAILDVGCGDGVLFRRFRPHGYSRYFGLDVSAAAIAALSGFEDERTHFFAADAEKHVPSETFDAVVFNESLYYFHDPIAVLGRYTQCLKPEGLVLISLFELSPRARSVLALVHEQLDLVDETRVGQGDKRWVCGVFAARH